MSRNVCFVANTLHFVEGGGHFWAYLNWALGLKANGCAVIWMEAWPPGFDADRLSRHLELLRCRLGAYGLDGSIAIFAWSEDTPQVVPPDGYLDLETAAAGADLLLNLAYDVPGAVVRRFRRSAMVDIDPGLTQLWMAAGQMNVAPHGTYFTTGETVGTSHLIPDCGLRWVYTPPCIALDCWPPVPAPPGSPFTTVSQWYAAEWVGTESEGYSNDKRQGFLPFVELPTLTNQPLELALNLGVGADAEEERELLEARGWRVRHARDVAGSPESYRRYVQGSRGEFSCVKPSCVRLQNAWISDRTLCYLASAKPAVIQHTGPSRILPERGGLLRFRTVEEAAGMLEEAAGDYEMHCRLARRLVEERFDATRVVRGILERVLG